VPRASCQVELSLCRSAGKALWSRYQSNRLPLLLEKLPSNKSNRTPDFLQLERGYEKSNDE
jgi:hypothetical protein